MKTTKTIESPENIGDRIINFLFYDRHDRGSKIDGHPYYTYFGGSFGNKTSTLFFTSHEDPNAFSVVDPNAFSVVIIHGTNANGMKPSGKIVTNDNDIRKKIKLIIKEYCDDMETYYNRDK